MRSYLLPKVSLLISGSLARRDLFEHARSRLRWSWCVVTLLSRPNGETDEALCEDTTSTSLSAALILLAHHPEHQDLIQQEANSVFSPIDGSLPPFSCFPKLVRPSPLPSSQLTPSQRYTTATFLETLRLFPPTPLIPFYFTDRYLPAHRTHSKLGDPNSCTVFLPSGSDLLLSPLTLHYNRTLPLLPLFIPTSSPSPLTPLAAALWADPLAFRPALTRWNIPGTVRRSWRSRLGRERVRGRRG